ncbi:MAG TPA: hypothetical protein VK671_16745, partial [Mucilaginibacter sp.]|nr:hypothetical protein [Mucilaginibacter sp.]
MRRNTLNKLLIIYCVLTILGLGCKAKKQAILVSKPAVTTRDNSISKIDAIRSSQLSFNTFSGKAKTKLDINGSTNDVTLNIRI